MSKSKGILPPKVFWTAEQIAALCNRYPDEKTEDLAMDIGRPVSSVYAKAAQLGLKKSADFLATPSSGRTNGRQGIGTRFKKGHASWNKGMKGLDLGGKETQFKPGQLPHNTQPIGSYRITRDGTLQRKISNDKGSNSMRWRGVHEQVWVEANGPVPAKNIVVFKPGMRTTELGLITLDKVECITLAENMKRNTRHNLPKELSDLIQLRGALTRQINKRNQHHEQ
jgi:hypothetical protein